jgi:phage terminase small subunit
MMTPKQQVFVDEYLVALNATEAAMRAGYSCKSAHVTDCNLMKEPHIARAIREAMDARARRTGIDADRIVLELARVAFSDLGRIADWGPDGVTLKPSNILAEADRTAIAEVSASAGKKGSGRIHIRLQNKQRALDSLARHFALYGRNAGLVAGRQDQENLADSARAKLRAQIEAYAQDIEREREEAQRSASHDASGPEDRPSAVLRDEHPVPEQGEFPNGQKKTI